MPEETPQHRALDILIKAALVITSPKLSSRELLVIAELMAANVPAETLAGMQGAITRIARNHGKRDDAGLTPIGEIEAGASAAAEGDETPSRG
jgi:hypothetical protein